MLRLIAHDDLDMIGARLRRAIPLPDCEIFDGLLDAIDAADRAGSRPAHRPVRGSPPARRVRSH
ncbi:hypothetical protein [Allosphingosinicella deserti]|uniref:Uncharacterized protein n=1 Tax=Allosphingosinicella deserti TaxID=2116704 RepID=A0A2P7QEQ0_9SPHN|nr:hypothetical protein [Sphingomonas deserti]PSJ36416.1 hypothetical protein C7I55_26625 [Sphingomonas deserti]